MDAAAVDQYYTEWLNPSSDQFKVRDGDVGQRYLDCSKIASDATRKSDATAASICGYLKFDKFTRFFGCDATTNCTYASQLEKATGTDPSRGGAFLMQFPACESMESVFAAICQGATREQIDTYVASQRIVGTSWVPPTTGTYNARLDELLAKCKNKADGGVEFELSESSGSGSEAPANNGEAVCEGHGYSKSECLALGNSCCEWESSTNPADHDWPAAPGTSTGACWSQIGQQVCNLDAKKTPSPSSSNSHSNAASPMWVLALTACLASAVPALHH